jgi:hypothetical protein
MQNGDWVRGYEEFGNPSGPLFVKISLEEARQLCVEKEIEEPPELIKAYESSSRNPDSSPSDRFAGTKDPIAQPLAVQPGQRITPEGTSRVRAHVRASRISTARDDPVEQTVVMLGKAVSQIKLIRFLAAREKQQAELETVASDVYRKRAIDKRKLRNTRRQVEHARDNLEGKRCPLRLHIGGNVVRLLDDNPVA